MRLRLGIVNENHVVSVYSFVSCVQSTLYHLLVASYVLIASRIYLTPHCCLTSLLRTLDDLVFVILFLLTSNLALGGLSFLPWPLLATTLTHMCVHAHTHICVCTHTTDVENVFY